MRKTKSLLALLCAVVAAFVLAVPAFAATGNYKVNITSKTPGHTYSAYQLFGGVLDQAEDTLSNVTWGDGIDSSKVSSLIEDLKNNDAFNSATNDDSTNVFAGITYDGENPNASAALVAKALENNIFKQTGSGAEVEDSTALDEFANVVSKFLSGKTTGVQSGPAEEGTAPNITYTYTLNGFAPGYYLIMDGAQPTADEDGSIPAKTKYILNIVGNVTVEAKADQPPIDKNIVIPGQGDGEDQLVKHDDAAIGDTVSFRLTSHVPDMDGYTKYYFVVTDTLSGGLTYKNDTVTVQIGDDILEPSDYAVTYTAASAPGEDSTLEIVLNDFIQYANQVGNPITIDYDVTLNENAVIGNQGNDNKVHLAYSNDPNFDYKGEDKPRPDEPMGITPDSVTYTYVTGFEIIKIDDGDPAHRLEGAQFTLTGTALNTVITYRDEFTRDDESGTYWKLIDGTYTTEAPTNDPTHDANYDDVNARYTLSIEREVITESEDVAYSGYVDSQGVLRFEGLKAGVYTLTETVTPDGFNTMAPMTVTITFNQPAGAGQKATWDIRGEQNGQDVTFTPITEGDPAVATGLFSTDIVNFSGATLPSTGGIGTTIFYAVGATLVIGAGVMLVSRYRANHMK